MAGKLYTEVGGASKLVRKLYTEVNGVSRLATKVYAEVGGVSKLIYEPNVPFLIGFRKYYYNADALNSNCTLQSWFAGYRENGLPGMDIVSHNAASYYDGAPLVSIDLNFINPAALAGKTLTVNFTVDLDYGAGYNAFRYTWLQNGRESWSNLSGGQGGQSGIGKTINKDMTRFSLQMYTGNAGDNDAHVTITSILIDGQQVFP